MGTGYKLDNDNKYFTTLVKLMIGALQKQNQHIKELDNAKIKITSQYKYEK